jgi:hypothetical protein
MFIYQGKWVLGLDNSFKYRQSDVPSTVKRMIADACEFPPPKQQVASIMAAAEAKVATC